MGMGDPPHAGERARPPAPTRRWIVVALLLMAAATALVAVPALRAPEQRSLPGDATSVAGPDASGSAATHPSPVSSPVERQHHTGPMADLPTDASPPTLRSACQPPRQAPLEGACVAALAALDVRDGSTRDQVAHLLANEPSPAVKAAIFNALQPVPLAQEDVAPLIDQLQAVHDAGDPALRANALVQWAQWDRGDRLLPLLNRGLHDPHPYVVRGAITAVALSNLRGQDLKESLLLLANDTAPDSELRSAAIDALHDFSLTRAEDAVVRRSESEIPAGAF